MIALAFLAGLWTATLRARRERIPGEKIADVTLWLMIGAILGARFVYVTTYWREEFANQPFTEVFMIQHGGLVYYGGFLGATRTAAIYGPWPDPIRHGVRVESFRRRQPSPNPIQPG